MPLYKCINKISTILIATIILLLVGTLCLNSLFPGQGFLVIGFAIILLALTVLYGKCFSGSDYVILLFCISFFDYSSSKGGLWNYVNIFFLFILLLAKRWKILFPKSISLIFGLFFILCLLEIVFINPASIEDRFSFILVFVSIILGFLFAYQINFDANFFIRFTKIFVLLLIFQFLVCLNQRFEILSSQFPFFPSQRFIEDHDLREFGLGVNKVRNWGTVSDFELFAEINSMAFVFYFSALLKYRKVISTLKLGIECRLLLLFSFLNILLSGTRSSLILVVFFFVVITLLQIKHLLKMKKIALYFSILCAILLLGGSYLIRFLGLETLFIRLSILNISNIDLETGEGMNRNGTYELAYSRITENDWILGNGYAFGDPYVSIMNGKQNTEFMDFHNLYYSLPIMYGWVGSLLFLLLFVTPLFFLFKTKRPFAISFFYMWLIFLINEYKIQFIRVPHYMMIIWVLLGLTYAFLKKNKSLFDFNNDLHNYSSF